MLDVEMKMYKWFFSQTDSLLQLDGLYTQWDISVEHLGGGIDPNSVNVIYNLADFLNKIVFGLIIYKAAIQDMRVNGQ